LQQGKYGKPEVSAVHLGAMASIPSWTGTQTRGMRVLDLHRAAKCSGASGESQVFWLGHEDVIAPFSPGTLGHRITE